MDSRGVKEILYFWIILLISVVIRLPFLGIFPPGLPEVFLPRLVTGILSAYCIVLTIFIVFQEAKNKNLALVTSFWLSIMPVFIEQSRIVSRAIWSLSLILTGVFMANYSKKLWLKYLILLVTFIFSSLVYRDFSSWQQSLQLININTFLYRFFKTISIEFLFYKNDSSWWSGLRTLGMLLPTTIPIFIIGLLNMLKQFNRNSAKHVIYILAVILLYALKPKFPEGKEFVLLSPYLALILAIGTLKLFEYFLYTNFIKRFLIGVWVLLLVYEHVWFVHIYVSHYSQRVRNERVYETEKF